MLVEDKLFATLDTTTRKIALPNKQPLLLTDTVGFVRKLPHRLVEAFNATLEEAALSDFLIHLLDASQPEVIEFFNTTMKVLAELGADERPMIIAFNKIDQSRTRRCSRACAGISRRRILFPSTPGTAWIRSSRGSRTWSPTAPRCAAAVAAERVGAIARLHRQAKILETKYLEDEVRIVALLPKRLAEEFVEFIVEDGPEKALALPPSLEAT